jgi:fructokinase
MENNLNTHDNKNISPSGNSRHDKILCIGEALIDMICVDKGKSLSEGNNFLKKAGGAPTNVAAAIAALGGQVELAAKVGVDPFGKHLVEVMKDFGVGTRWMMQDENHFTTFAFVSLMENGERDFYFNRGADGQLSQADIDAIDVKEFSIIHFGSATGFLPGPLQEAYKSLLQKAIEKNIFISFDPNYRNLLFQNNQASFIEQSWTFLNSCTFFKVSDEEALMLTGKPTIMEAATDFLQKTKAVFAITLGKEGTLLGLNGSTNIISSIPVKAIDTTGAGDAFVGAVLYQLSELNVDAIKLLSLSGWKHFIANANKAGARTCEYMGAMEAFKHLSQDIID